MDERLDFNLLSDIFILQLLLFHIPYVRFKWEAFAYDLFAQISNG